MYVDRRTGCRGGESGGGWGGNDRLKFISGRQGVWLVHGIDGD